VADWDSADLLARIKRLTDAPALDEAMTDADWYQYLTQGQQRIVRIIATHAPGALMEAPATLSTADGGVTYTFPNSDFPLGYAEIRDGRAGSVLTPGSDFNEWADYVLEGSRIRMVGGRARTFGNGLYCRYVKLPAAISASSEPTLQPEPMRELIVYAGAEEWAMTGGLRDPAPYASLLQKKLSGDPMIPGDTGWLGSLKTRVFGQGSDGAYGGMAYWWRGSLR